MVSQYPADTAGHANLALAYFLSRDIKKALEEQKSALVISPHSILQRNNYSMYALYDGDFDTALKEAQSILQENPKFDQAFRTSALAELGLGHTSEAQADYEKLRAVSPYGASIASTGLADLDLYQGKLADAASILEKAIAADLAAKDTESAAGRTATLALIQIALGKTQEALSSAGKAAEESKETRRALSRGAGLHRRRAGREGSATGGAAFAEARNGTASLRKAHCRRSATQKR